MDSVDVVVAGSGAAGLVAALAAARGGARVLVLEASHRFGGATGISGGQAWVPGNHRMGDRGVADSAQDALTYLRAHTADRDDGLLEAFVRAAPAMARFVEEHSPIEFTAMAAPDSFAEHPGGRPAARNLEVAPVAAGDLGDPGDLVWPGPYPPALTNDEVIELGLMRGAPIPFGLIGERMEAGLVTGGTGLVVGLLRGCRDAGVELRRNAPVREILRENGAVTGVRAGRDGDVRDVRAARGVVLACGGFEHDPELSRRLLAVPEVYPASPPTARGDGLRLAAGAGAALAHTSESWCWPVTGTPDGRFPDPDVAAPPRTTLVVAERMMPHVIWVNAAGLRFVNESGHNCALAFAEIDAATGRRRNHPAWAIVDAQYRARYPLAGAAPGQPPPATVAEAGSLPELAAAIGVDAAGLSATVDRFNHHASAGTDPDFGRGATAYDHSMGDPDAPHPNLGTIAEPPYFALPVRSGAVGTKGGPRTDAQARVLGWDGAPIPGLYAAGNAAAAVIGPGIVSPGTTIGVALTWGWLAGTDLGG